MVMSDSVLQKKCCVFFKSKKSRVQQQMQFHKLDPVAKTEGDNHQMMERTAVGNQVNRVILTRKSYAFGVVCIPARLTTTSG